MDPTPGDRLELTLLDREQTFAGLADRLRAIAARVSDEEFVRRIYAMADARAEAKRGRRPPA